MDFSILTLFTIWITQ